MSWRRKAEREYLEADQEFVEEILPVGSVDLSSFGLIADATQYFLVEEEGEVHIRPEIASLRELVTSLARGGTAVNVQDAELAVQRFAALWEEKIRAKGKWTELVQAAREAGEVRSPPGRKRRRLPWRRS